MTTARRICATKGSNKITQGISATCRCCLLPAAITQPSSGSTSHVANTQGLEHDGMTDELSPTRFRGTRNLTNSRRENTNRTRCPAFLNVREMAIQAPYTRQKWNTIAPVRRLSWRTSSCSSDTDPIADGISPAENKWIGRLNLGLSIEVVGFGSVEWS